MKRESVILLGLSLLALTSQVLFVHATTTQDPILEWIEEPECQVIIDETLYNGKLYKETLYIANRWPQWLNFTVTTEDASSAIMELKMVLLTDADGNAFFHFMECVQPEGWYAIPDEFDSNKNPTVIYFRSTDAQYYLHCETGEFDVRFSQGPSSCIYNFAMYIIDSNTGTTKRDLYACVDNIPPIVDEVWAEPIPNAKFPDDVFKHVTRVRIWARAHDPTPHPSGVKKVDLYLELADPKKRGPWPMKWDDKEQAWYLWVEWEEHLWESERWYIPSANASDAVCNKGEETKGESFFFCWEPPTIEIWDLDRDREGIQIHVDQDLSLNLTTGFTPNADFTIYFDNTLVKEGTTNKRGRALTTFVVPEVPRGFYRVRVVDEYDNEDEKNVEVIPWVWPEENQHGPVGTTITEFIGKGFKEDTLVDVVYRDFWKGNVRQETTSDRNATHEIEWKPYLDNLTLISETTDSKGSFTVEIEIPDSYGGLHPVFAEERTGDVRSFNSMFFHVKTSIWVEPSEGLKEQFITLYASGLPLPHYSLKVEPWRGRFEDPQIYNERDWCLALDFGPRKHWLWENKHIINGFFDSDWFEDEWWPVSYTCTSDPESPVWGGQLCWRDSEFEYHTGSPFIKVPVLPRDDYTIRLYQFGVNDGVRYDKTKDGIDHYEYEASTSFSVTTNPSVTGQHDENPGKNSALDLNGDCVINIQDIAQICWAFNSKPGDRRWVASADLNEDGVISILDVTLIANNYFTIL
jgi:hypothetical protein